MSRRKQMPADSLELLLDTICNTFGGILFIALLVVILLLISGKSTDVTKPRSHDNAVDETTARNQLETLTDLKSRLKSSLEKQTETISSLARDDLQEVVISYQTELVRNTEMKGLLPLLQKQLQQAEQDEEDLSQATSEAQLKLAELQGQLEKIQASLKAQRESRKTTLRMPVLKSPGDKNEILFVVQFNRLYCWHRYSASQIREGLNVDDFLILSESIEGAVTTPNPVAGIPLDSTIESQNKIVQLLRRFRPANFYLTIVVRPDSYGSFQYLRNAAVASGYEYRLVPATDADQYVDRGGAGGSVQ